MMSPTRNVKNISIAFLKVKLISEIIIHNLFAPFLLQKLLLH